MKKIITSAFIAIMPFINVSAQTTPAENIKYPYAIYKRIHNPNVQDHLISVLVKGDVEKITEEVQKLGGSFKYSAGDIACVNIPVNKIKLLAEKTFVRRIEGSDAKIQTLNDQMIWNNNVAAVQQGIGMTQGYDGTGVCVGIIDEGIDVNHKDLHDANGKTRIKYIWDQRLPYNPNYTPTPYNYGQNYTNTQIDNNENDVTDSVVDHDYSHGTHVTGIAAGNGLAVNNYHGVAPKADIIFVAVDETLQGDDFLNKVEDAVDYIFKHADSLHEPCSINISMGTYFGSHDGKDLQTQIIDNFISEKNGRFMSCAAGNIGTALFHVHTNVTPDSEFTWLGGYASTNQLYFELWADSADLANVQWLVAADDSAPFYDYRGGTDFRSATLYMGDTIYNIFNGQNLLGTVETYVDSSFGRYTLECLITPDSAGYLWRFMTKGTGKFDCWSNDFVPGGAGLPDPSIVPLISKYQAPDQFQNICSGFQCSHNVMTVGNYVNRNSYSDVYYNQVHDPTVIVGSLNMYSSHGPTRDGRIKPEVAATGTWVLSCAAQYDLAGTIACCPTAVAAGGQHRIGTGTSMASPCVAGTAALYFQKYPNASYQEVRDAIMGCTKTDQFTSGYGALPNNYWGYGKLNAYGAINGCSAVGINEFTTNMNVFLENYPNPFSEQTTIHYDLSGLNKHVVNALIAITDAIGRNVLNMPISGLDGNVVLNKNDLSSGIFFYSLIVDDKVIRTNKLVVF